MRTTILGIISITIGLFFSVFSIKRIIEESQHWEFLETWGMENLMVEFILCLIAGIVSVICGYLTVKKKKPVWIFLVVFSWAVFLVYHANQGYPIIEAFKQPVTNNK